MRISAARARSIFMALFDTDQVDISDWKVYRNNICIGGIDFTTSTMFLKEGDKDPVLVFGRDNGTPLLNFQVSTAAASGKGEEASK